MNQPYPTSGGKIPAKNKEKWYEKNQTASIFAVVQKQKSWAETLNSSVIYAWF